jgi:hypothetical protein
MPMMITRDIHNALRSAEMLGPKGQETEKLKAVLADEGMRLGQLHNIYVSRKGSKIRPFPHVILLLEEITGTLHDFYHVVIDLEYKVLEKKHPHKSRKSKEDVSRFYGGKRDNSRQFADE